MAYPLTNAAPSPIGFTIEPREQYGAWRHAESRGWEIGGVFHSHPEGGAELSAVDLSQPHDPAWFHVVVGFGGVTRMRVWRIVDGAVLELEVSDVPDDGARTTARPRRGPGR